MIEKQSNLDDYHTFMQDIVGEDVGLADRLEEMKLRLSSLNTVK